MGIIAYFNDEIRVHDEICHDTLPHYSFPVGKVKKAYSKRTKSSEESVAG